MTDHPDKERFEAHDAANAEVRVGVVTYQASSPNLIVYTHTEIDAEFAGQGIGTKLARAVLDDARDRGRSVVLICPFLTEWVAGHPEYSDMIVSSRRVK